MDKNKNTTFAAGEMAEWSIAAVLKTVEGNTSGGSNPSFSAQKASDNTLAFFITSNSITKKVTRPKLVTLLHTYKVFIN